MQQTFTCIHWHKFYTNYFNITSWSKHKIYAIFTYDNCKFRLFFFTKKQQFIVQWSTLIRYNFRQQNILFNACQLDRQKCLFHAFSHFITFRCKIICLVMNKYQIDYTNCCWSSHYRLIHLYVNTHPYQTSCYHVTSLHRPHLCYQGNTPYLMLLQIYWTLFHSPKQKNCLWLN